MKTKLRQEKLNQDLISYHPKKWGINIPCKNYSVRLEDLVPALSGAIGKVALVAAFALAWAKGFGITDPTFVAENVRLEIVIASVLSILFCAILDPYSGPPGTLAPLIPIIPVMVASGVHPLPLSILIGGIGLLITSFKYFSKVVELNGTGTKGGIILLFGFLGITSSLDNLKTWTTAQQVPSLFIILIAGGVILYLLSNKFNLRWLIIPLCAVIALVLSGAFGLYPTLKTSMNFPIINPSWWWNEKWGIGWGINARNFLNAFPFALLAIVMWPLDALAVKTIQESNYPKQAKQAVFDMNATYTIVSIRNILGAFLGGSQIAAVWRSFMIPLGIVKRPIGASALFLGIVGLLFGVLGTPIDIATFPPLLWLVLIFGVYIPLAEVGLNTIKNNANAQIAALCFIVGIAINPVIGWVVAVTVENFHLIPNDNDKRVLTKKDQLLTAAIAVVTLLSFMLTGTR